MPNYGPLKQLHADFATLGQDMHGMYRSWLVSRQLRTVGHFMDQLLSTKGICMASLGLLGNSMVQKNAQQFRTHFHQTAHHLGL